MFKGLIAVVVMMLASLGVAQDKPFGERSIMSKSNIHERVSRNGVVCLAGEDCAGQVAQAAPEEPVEVAAGPRAGDAIYNSYCAGCHVAGAAGAPKVGDVDAWAARLDARGGDEGLWKSAWRGIGAMPPKGMCMDCSEEEFESAVVYMVENSK